MHTCAHTDICGMRCSVYIQQFSFLSHLIKDFVQLNHVIQNYKKIMTRVFHFSAQSCLLFPAHQYVPGIAGNWSVALAC